MSAQTVDAARRAIAPTVTPAVVEPPNNFEERNRLTKATLVADRLSDLFGPDTIPTNEGCRIAAQTLVDEHQIADRPFSNRSCEMVRAILAVRADAFDRLARRAAQESGRHPATRRQ